MLMGDGRGLLSVMMGALGPVFMNLRCAACRFSSDWRSPEAGERSNVDGRHVIPGVLLWLRVSLERKKGHASASQPFRFWKQALETHYQSQQTEVSPALLLQQKMSDSSVAKAQCLWVLAKPVCNCRLSSLTDSIITDKHTLLQLECGWWCMCMVPHAARRSTSITVFVLVIMKKLTNRARDLQSRHHIWEGLLLGHIVSVEQLPWRPQHLTSHWCTLLKARNRPRLGIVLVVVATVCVHKRY